MQQDFSKDEAADYRPFDFATATAPLHRPGQAPSPPAPPLPQSRILATWPPRRKSSPGLLARRSTSASSPCRSRGQATSAAVRGGVRWAFVRPRRGQQRPACRAWSRKSWRMRRSPLPAAQQHAVEHRHLLPPDRDHAARDHGGRRYGSHQAPRGVRLRYSILPEFPCGQSRFLELSGVAGHRWSLRQALAMPRTEYPRALTKLHRARDPGGPGAQSIRISGSSPHFCGILRHRALTIIQACLIKGFSDRPSGGCNWRRRSPRRRDGYGFGAGRSRYRNSGCQ